MIECKVCGTPFSPLTKKHLMCSDACREKRYKSIFNITKYKNYQNSAAKRSIPFGLTLEEFMDMWRDPCSYCGSEIDTIGIDRIDSSQGYVLGNIVPCCGTCNLMKHVHSVEFFIDHCKKVSKFNP